VSFSYGDGAAVIKNFSAAFSAGEDAASGGADIIEASPTVIMGPSGCGKTTLLKLCARLIKPQAGNISAAVQGVPQRVSHAAAPAAAFMFQEDRLLPRLNIITNVALPLLDKVQKKEALSRSGKLLEQMGLANYAARFPDELSGGEKRRAALARSFVTDSRFILFDEPFHSLDIALRLKLLDLTLNFLREKKCAALFVSHEVSDALYIGKRIVVLDKNAKIVLDELNANAGERYIPSANPELEARVLDALAFN
jgi:ABC-type nitrate/sulfonate/bicarbonate transport system ATPase subunit